MGQPCWSCMCVCSCRHKHGPAHPVTCFLWFSPCCANGPTKLELRVRLLGNLPQRAAHRSSLKTLRKEFPQNSLTIDKKEWTQRGKASPRRHIHGPAHPVTLQRSRLLERTLEHEQIMWSEKNIFLWVRQNKFNGWELRCEEAISHLIANPISESSLAQQPPMDLRLYFFNLVSILL